MIVILLGFNDTTLVDCFVPSPSERENRDRRDRDERAGTGKKEEQE